MHLLAITNVICRWVDSVEANDTVKDTHMLVPTIPAGVSGTALAASLLRDGWSVSVFIYVMFFIFQFLGEAYSVAFG